MKTQPTDEGDNRMIDLTRLHHHGIVVADVDRAVADYERALGVRFAEVREFAPFALWTPEDGLREMMVRATYSLGGPLHLELVQGEGAFYDADRPEPARHLGLWVDDLTVETQRLVDAGWTVRAANAAPEDGYGVIAYLASPDRAILVELISTVIKPDIDEWLGEG